MTIIKYFLYIIKTTRDYLIKKRFFNILTKVEFDTTLCKVPQPVPEFFQLSWHFRFGNESGIRNLQRPASHLKAMGIVQSEADDLMEINVC